MPQLPLSDAQHIRSRPGMYIGGLNPRGRRVMITGIVEDLLNLRDAERPRITITFNPDGLIELTALGAAPDLPPLNVVSHPGHTAGFAPESNHASLVIAAALCDPLDIRVTRAGRTWSQSFSRGLATGPLHDRTTDQPSAAHLRLRPDPTLFQDTANDFHALCGALQALALFHPTAILAVADQAANLHRDYHYPRGPVDYLHELEPTCTGHPDSGRCWCLDLTDGPDRLRAAIFYRHVGPFLAQSFLNGQRLLSGPHIDGFRQALAHLATQPNAHPNRHIRPGDHPAENLTAVFVLTLADPYFKSSTKDCLTGDRPWELAYRMTLEQLPAQLAPASPVAMP